jgi:hypothetical protein
MRRTSFRFPVTTLAGSTLKNIRAIHDDHIVEPKYRNKYLLTNAVAGIFEVFNFAEQLFWQKRIQNHQQASPPIFIIGFWRSGTTLLHNLLCQDPEAAYTTTFQTVFPNIILTQSWWLKPLINIFLPAKRPYDEVGMDVDFPQEEDFGLMNMQPLSIYKFFLFPADFDQIIEQELFTGKQPPQKIAQWKNAYRNMITKALFNTGGNRYIGKNPCHLTRTGLLMEMFPEAKFIFIHRHPYKVVESLYHFILSVFPGVQLQDVPLDFSREKVVRMYRTVVETYLHDREMIAPSNLIELKMDEFLKDIPGQLNKIYDKFGLGDFGRVSPEIEKYLKDNPAPERHPHPPTSDTIQLVNKHLSGIMNNLGYGIFEPGTVSAHSPVVVDPVTVL